MPNRVKDPLFDEISTVDTPAHQDALFVLAKRFGQGDDMPEAPEYFDAQGQPVNPDTMAEPGWVQDGDGKLFAVNMTDDEADEAIKEFLETQRQEELAGAGVSKMFQGGTRRPATPGQFAASRLSKANPAAVSLAQFPQAYAEDEDEPQGAAATQLPEGGSDLTKSVLAGLRDDLSKAVSNEDKVTALSKSVGELISALEKRDKQTNELMEIAKGEHRLRLTREYTELAKGYNVAGAGQDELGAALLDVAEHCTPVTCQTIDKAFRASGTKLFEEAGFDSAASSGGGTVVDEVESFIDTVLEKRRTELGKSADDGDATVTRLPTREQVMKGVFDERPELYSQHKAEVLGRQS